MTFSEKIDALQDEANRADFIAPVNPDFLIRLCILARLAIQAKPVLSQMDFEESADWIDSYYWAVREE